MVQSVIGKAKKLGSVEEVRNPLDDAELISHGKLRGCTSEGWSGRKALLAGVFCCLLGWIYQGGYMVTSASFFSSY